MFYKNIVYYCIFFEDYYLNDLPYMYKMKLFYIILNIYKKISWFWLIEKVFIAIDYDYSFVTFPFYFIWQRVMKKGFT